MNYFSIIWSILKTILGIADDKKALTDMSESKGKLEAENEQKAQALKAASLHNDVSTDIDGLSDTAVDSKLRKSYPAEW